MSKTTESSGTSTRERPSLRQGDIVRLEKDIFESNWPELHDHSLFAVVISHDCDIVSVGEPNIELIPVKLIEKLDSRKTRTKSPRTLHLEASADKDLSCIEVDARKKASVSKEILLRQDPVFPLSLDTVAVSELTQWLSARYLRAALPEEFDRRLGRVKSKFEKLVRDLSDGILAILFIFDDGQEKKECGPKESYVLSISLVLREGESLSDFEGMATQILELFETAYGTEQESSQPEIELRQCVAVSENSLTLRQYRSAIHFRLEWLSFDSDPPGPVIV
jgi:hypothetical protein